MQESIAKHSVVCNYCTAELGQHYPEGHKHISVSLSKLKPAYNGGTEKETHHFCDEACLGAYVTHNYPRKDVEIAKASLMAAYAKHFTQCDNCKASLKNEGDDKKQHIAATLANGKDANQQYHYCDEECLRQHLNGRAKRKRERSNASLGDHAYFAEGKVVLEFQTKK